MKKSLIITLVLVFVLGIAGTAFAGPFADVPAKHWAYDAVAKLAKAGIVEGYGDGTFRGDKALTRYEMAIVVAKAMEHSDKADAANKALIEKLYTEFKAELTTLGVRVTNLENRMDNVKWGGELRVRYDSQKQDGHYWVAEETQKKHHKRYDRYDRERFTNSQSYVDMWATAQINPDWIAKIEYESNRSMTTGKAGSEDDANTTRIFAQGPLFGTKATLGRFNPFAGYGLVIDDNMTGAQFEFGDKLKTRIAVGRLNRGDNLGKPDFNYNFLNSYPFLSADSMLASVDYPNYQAVELDYAVNKDTNIKAAYHNISNATVYNFERCQYTGHYYPTDSKNQSVHYWELGFDTKLSQDFAFMATYSKSNIEIPEQDNKGYFTQLTYKAADLKTPGSYDIFTNYRKIPVNSQIDSTWDYARDVKGWSVGFDYVPAKNIKIQSFYLKGTTITDNNDANVYRAQVQFFF